MTTYAILCNPGHNRVYFGEALRLSTGELALCSRRFSAACSDIGCRDIAGVPYICLSVEDKLSGADIRILSRLSFTYALFELHGELLAPIGLTPWPQVDPKMSGMLKYQGKTNELFTRLMLNVALYSSDYCDAERVSLLDPVCGRGTTLFEGLSLGLDSFGIDIDGKSVSEGYHFAKKFFELEKYKHTVKTERLSGENRSYSFVRHRFEVSRSKDEQKHGRALTLELAEGDSEHTAKLHGKNRFGVIVGDLPYGIQHGNVSGGSRGGSKTRNPDELLHKCLPGWCESLAPGGALALSWNTNVLRREKLAELLSVNGLDVCDDGVYRGFAHRVDQVVMRDIIIARKGRK